MELKITIDPGHGQYSNKSPNNSNYMEGTQMWLLAEKLCTALKSYGFEVFNTRPNITDNPSLDYRGKMAGNNSCNMFLSLHSNAPGKSADGTYSTTVTGTTVYYSLTRPENKELADKLGNKVAELMGHKFRGSCTKQYPNKPTVDYYGVIRASAQSGCKCALLIEHGFHTSISDSNWLLSDANLQKLAEAEAEIIAEYFGASKIGGETQNDSFAPYLVKVIASTLNIRKGPGTNYKTNGTIKRDGVYTIVEESDGKGATKWGKLKSGAGWISLDYAKKL